MKSEKILITRYEYERLKTKAQNIDKLKNSLKYCIKEADGWYDESRGGKIESPEMDEARELAA